MSSDQTILTESSFLGDGYTAKAPALGLEADGATESQAIYNLKRKIQESCAERGSSPLELRES